MEIRILKNFLMIAEEENITRTAELLHMTQPNLSRQMMQLESELGVSLFKRSRYRMILTEDGLLLKRRAQEIIDLAEKTEQEFRRQNGELAGTIAIGSGEYRNSRLLADAMADFRRLHPLVGFDLFSGDSDNIKERLEKGLLDFGLLLQPVDISKYDFIVLPLKEEWGILVRNDSPLAKQESVSPADLAQVPLIFTKRSMMRNSVTNWFGEYARHMDIAASGTLPYNMAAVAASGLGVCICLRHNSYYDDVTYVPLSPKLESETVLVWKKGQVVSPTVAEFIRYFKGFIGHFNNAFML